jgi:hypothetical protein
MSSSADNWVKDEFSSASFGDARLNNRLLHIAKQLASKFGSNIASSFSQWKDIKATYRFFANKKVTMHAILTPHIKETIKRITAHKRVLILQDTTYFNFCDRKKTKGLDITQRSKVSTESEGLMLHNTLAVSDQGIPLGLLDQYFIDRKHLKGENVKEKRKIRHWNNGVDKKESMRWINVLKKMKELDFGDTETIHIADRECDFYEFFREADTLGENVLIRAARNRSINKEKRRESPSAYLFDHLKEQRAQGKTTISIQINGKEKFRDADLSIIYTPITMPPPPNKTTKKDGSLPIIELTAIMAIERVPPKNTEPLCWVLLTNLPVSTLADAIQKIQWYSARWNIELFHKVIKSGCGVEKSQLRDAERLKKYIVLKSVIAWRLFWLSRHYLKHKDDSCLTVITKDECEILYRKTMKTKNIPDTPPTVGEVFIWIAKLGGYIGRRSDPPPGMISLWKGWQRFMDMVEDYHDICG